MNSQERNEINKKLAGLLNQCWHELEKRARGTLVEHYEDDCIYPLYTCTKCGRKAYREGFDWTDFIAHPTLVLKEMLKREDWPRFLDSVGHFDFFYHEHQLIVVDYILDTTEGSLAKAAIEWLEKQEEVKE